MSLSHLPPRAGVGNWAAFPHDCVPQVEVAAREWRKAVDGVAKPWLCWCVHDDWCAVQQRLVQACGWTPVVGTDGRVASPTVLPGSVFVDFNRTLKLPVMWMHFPLEFVHLFCDRLAFWHSDVLPPVQVMNTMAAEFDAIRPGEYVGVSDPPGIQQRLRRLWRGVSRMSGYWLKNWNAKRWFEVVGCTTADASRRQFESGCGMWRHIEQHPNAPAQWRGKPVHYDHGVGLWYWQTYCEGRALPLGIDVDPFHYTTKGGRRISGDSRGTAKGANLTANHRLDQISASLGLN